MVVHEHSATAPPVDTTRLPCAFLAVARDDVHRVVDADAEGDRQRDEVQEVDLNLAQPAPPIINTTPEISVPSDITPPPPGRIENR